MKEKSSEYLEIDLLRLLKALWHRAWAIVLAAVIFGGAAFAYASFLITPLYEASAYMYVNNSSFSLGSNSFSLTELSAAQSLVSTYTVILKTRTTLNEVIEEADLSYSYEELSGMISTSAVNSTEVFEIKVTGSDPEEAELIANTIVKILPDRISDIVDGSSVRVVDYAVVPSAKASPNITRYTAMGLLLGVVVSCAVLVLIEIFDDLIRSEDYLLQTYDVPVLAVIPELSSSGGHSHYGRNDYYQAAAIEQRREQRAQ